MAAYYNEHDPFAAAWLRELITAGHIAAGDVDERSIIDVRPDDLRGYTQAHFFAGIGGWSYALRLAGWPDDRPVWTGSCPCQPFSSAGKQAGTDDPRHLWPAWFRLIRECRPHVVFGEQVEAAINHGWLDLVCDDLEREGYAVGAVGLPAASVGAPHIRQRLWFVADRAEQGREPGRASKEGNGRDSAREQSGRFCTAGELADGDRRRCEQQPQQYGDTAQDSADWYPRGPHAGRCGELGDVGHAEQSGLEGLAGDGDGSHEPGRKHTCAARPVAASGWSDLEWLACRDGKARPTEPGLFPLAHGIPARVGRLRGYGNAIVPPLAAEFIKAYREVLGEDLHGL